MLCPKCHQPLEGDEVYICCGSDAIAWRCRNCFKVSEGFAFPYGACPHCGGSLERLFPRDLAGDTDAIEGVRTAFEIELGGRAFYRRAAKEAESPALRDLFGRLAEMEDEHMETLSRRYHIDVPEVPEGFQTRSAAVFAGMQGRPDDPESLFRIAVAFEERAAAFFEEQSRQAPEGSPQSELYRELAAEEREHADLLATEHDRMKAGKPGLL